ncbi:tetratricopeptide repeat 1-like [Olea europaea subsp. europaea]|uniref:Tetratricopeptide repeat 1-like n=1 Tax=Olea europaea subsp. europaea TaxID=158383 RepID=A0A8S0VMB7_OLEEU|nr:tetratricopeptide repeat 1-like [Olea europaea subsp. europaea]
MTGNIWPSTVFYGFSKIQTTCHKAIPALVDLAEISMLGDHKKLGDSIVNVLHECTQSQGTGHNSISSRAKEEAAALVVKLEGNSLFSSGDISGDVSKYSEALALCPMRSKKERVVLYSNRAQCHLLLQKPWDAISDATRALSIQNLVNRHAKSLWRRAQAYDMLGLAKESLLDAILFIKECSQSTDADLRQNKVPDYAERLVKKQMRAAWLFKEAATKHGDVNCDGDAGAMCGQDTDDSERQTASESDVRNDGRDELDDYKFEWKNDVEWKDKHGKVLTKDMKQGYNEQLAEAYY